MCVDSPCGTLLCSTTSSLPPTLAAFQRAFRGSALTALHCRRPCQSSHSSPVPLSLAKHQSRPPTNPAANASGAPPIPAVPFPAKQRLQKRSLFPLSHVITGLDPVIPAATPSFVLRPVRKHNIAPVPASMPSGKPPRPQHRHASPQRTCQLHNRNPLRKTASVKAPDPLPENLLTPGVPGEDSPILIKKRPKKKPEAKAPRTQNKDAAYCLPA